MGLATLVCLKCNKRLFAAPYLLLLLAVFLGGCGGTSFPVQTETVPYTEEQMLARELAQEARYRLRVGDRFKLAFKYETELNQTNLVVLPDGYTSIGGVGNVKAAGLTVEQLNNSLLKKYSQDYRNPELTIIVEEISAPEVYVMGEVDQPGLYKMPDGGTGVLQAISLAGGFNEDAQKGETVLLRATNEGFMIRSFDLSNVQSLGLMDLTYLDIQAYDIIYVPRSSLGDFSYVSEAIFGSALNVTRFFWDVYALANIDKIDRIVR